MDKDLDQTEQDLKEEKNHYHKIEISLSFVKNLFTKGKTSLVKTMKMQTLIIRTFNFEKTNTNGAFQKIPLIRCPMQVRVGSTIALRITLKRLIN